MCDTCHKTHQHGRHDFLDGYCSTVQGVLDWFEVDLGFAKLLFIQTDLCSLLDSALAFESSALNFSSSKSPYSNLKSQVYGQFV